MGGNEREASRRNVSATLTKLNDALACEIGPEETKQVSEYIEHHEFGLALELIVSLMIHHGLDGRAHEADVEGLFKKMEMDASEYAAEWRKHLRREA